MKNILENLTLSHSKGVGPVAIGDLLRIYGTAEKVLQSSVEEMQQNGLRPRLINALNDPEARRSAERTLAHCTENNVRILIKGTSERYPQLLLECSDSPHILYQYGDLDINHYKLVSMVGTRRASENGKNSTQQIVGELVEAYDNIAVVSGLALGIDKQAHLAALHFGVPTIAVLPGWVLDIAPTSHKELARNIIRQGGALLSDMPPGTIIRPSNFLSRNRIVAGMSHTTIVVESPERGGSLSTARIANSYNRPVFALPGRSSDMNCFGTNQLIKSNCAILYQDLGDLALEMQWTRKNCKKIMVDSIEGLGEECRSIYESMPENTPITIDELSENLDITITQCSIAVVELEADGFIRSTPGGFYIRSTF